MYSKRKKIEDSTSYMPRKQHFLRSHKRDTGLTLLDLNVDVIAEVFSYLTFSELVNLRLVSKKVKDWSDLCLKSRKSTITVERNHLYKRICFTASLHSTAKKLKFNNINIPIEKILDSVTPKLCNLESLTVSWYSKFPNLTSLSHQIKKLSLRNVYADDTDLSNLLRSMQQLECVKVSYDVATLHKVSGACFSSVGSSVKSIKWINMNWESHVSFNGQGMNVKHFTFIDSKKKDVDSIVDLIKREMPNLESLRLKCSLKSINGLESLSKLKQLYVDRYHRSFDRYIQPLNSVEKVSLVVDSALNKQQVTNLSLRFPNVCDLTVIENMSTFGLQRFIPMFTESLLSIKSVKLFTFHQSQIELPTLLQSLVTLNSIKPFVFSYNGDEAIKETPPASETACDKQRVKSRRIQNLYILVPRYEDQFIGTLRARNFSIKMHEVGRDRFKSLKELTKFINKRDL